ncbi:hypothetical protein MAR_015040, partial [Mya arenaria]
PSVTPPAALKSCKGFLSQSSVTPSSRPVVDPASPPPTARKSCEGFQSQPIVTSNRPPIVTPLQPPCSHVKVSNLSPAYTPIAVSNDPPPPKY